MTSARGEPCYGWARGERRAAAPNPPITRNVLPEYRENRKLGEIQQQPERPNSSTGQKCSHKPVLFVTHTLNHAADIFTFKAARPRSFSPLPLFISPDLSGGAPCFKMTLRRKGAVPSQGQTRSCKTRLTRTRRRSLRVCSLVSGFVRWEVNPAPSPEIFRMFCQYLLKAADQYFSVELF